MSRRKMITVHLFLIAVILPSQRGNKNISQFCLDTTLNSVSNVTTNNDIVFH